jgi:hypothetical protein
MVPFCSAFGRPFPDRSGGGQWRISSTGAHLAEIRPDVGTYLATSLAGEQRLDFGKPSVIRPSIGVDCRRVAALVIRATDQEAATDTHLSKGDFGLADGFGHPHDSADRSSREAATDWALNTRAPLQDAVEISSADFRVVMGSRQLKRGAAGSSGAAG